MTTKSREFKKGLRLKPTTEAATLEGEERVDSSANKKKIYLDSSERSVVTEDQTQTLENKTIDGTSATGNNTVTADADNISYDNATSGLTATDVKAAIDELDAAIEGQDEASEISYDNSTSGLAATDVQAAIDEVDGNLDTHIADTSTHGVSGDIVGTSDAQILTNKTIDADSNTISNIDNNEIKAAAGIDATKIADGSVSDTEFQHLDGVTSDIQTQLDAKLDDMSSTTDNALVRTDGTAGDAVQDSSIIISDVDAMSGVTELDVDNVKIDGNTISSTDTNGNVELSPDGTGIVKANSDHQVTGSVIRDVSADSTTGSNVTLATPATKNIRLTDGSLESIDMIPAGTDGQEILLINATGDTVDLNDSTGATAANQIKTGTQNFISLSDEASIPLVYDGTEAKWMVSAGVGSGSGSGINFASPIGDMESAKTSNFTTSGGTLTITETASEVGRGTRGVKHVATAGSQSFTSQNIPIPNGYRGDILLVKFVYKCDQERTLTLEDVTNSRSIDVTLPATGSSWQVVKQEFGTLSSTENMTYKFESSAADTFLLDDVIINNDLQIGNINVEQNYYIQQLGNALTSRDPLRYNIGSAEIVNEGHDLIEPIDNSVDGRTDFTAKTDLYLTVSVGGQVDASFGIYEIKRSSDDQRFIRSNQIESSNKGIQTTTSMRLAKGDSFYVDCIIGAFRNDGGNPVEVSVRATAVESTAVSEQLMQENNFSALIANNGSASITSQSSNFISSVVRNSAGSVTVNFVTDFFSEIPAITALPLNNDNNTQGLSYSSLSSSSVIILSSRGDNFQDRDFTLIVQKQGDDYTPITRNIIASEKPTVIISDHKAASTEGGTFTSGSWQTRDMNNVEGDDYLVSVSGNQIEFQQKGTYLFEGGAPAYQVNQHQARLRNTTTSSTLVVGSCSRSGTSAQNHCRSMIRGVKEVAKGDVIELQHRCDATRNTVGFGENCNFGEDEIYAILKITKMK